MNDLLMLARVFGALILSALIISAIAVAPLWALISIIELIAN